MTAIWWPTAATITVLTVVLVAGWSSRGYRGPRHLPRAAPRVRLELHRPATATRTRPPRTAQHRLVR